VLSQTQQLVLPVSILVQLPTPLLLKWQGLGLLASISLCLFGYAPSSCKALPAETAGIYHLTSSWQRQLQKLLASAQQVNGFTVAPLHEVFPVKAPPWWCPQLHLQVLLGGLELYIRWLPFNRPLVGFHGYRFLSPQGMVSLQQPDAPTPASGAPLHQQGALL
jgi:hypothetical protein